MEVAGCDPSDPVGEAVKHFSVVIVAVCGSIVLTNRLNPIWTSALPPLAAFALTYT